MYFDSSPCYECLGSRVQHCQAEEGLLEGLEVYCTDNAVQHSLTDFLDEIGRCWRSNNLQEPY